LKLGLSHQKKNAGWEEGAEENTGNRREDVTGIWRKCDEKAYNLFPSSDFFSVVK
jgi:hypothetical protein